MTVPHPGTIQEPTQSPLIRTKDAPRAHHLGIYKGFRSSGSKIIGTDQYIHVLLPHNEEVNFKWIFLSKYLPL